MAVIEGTGGPDALTGLAANDSLYGYAGNDTLWGLQGADLLVGANGDDTLDGGAGDDRLYGGDGNDRLDGTLGLDRLEGGNGDDVYVISGTENRPRLVELADGGIDTIESAGWAALVPGGFIENIRLTGTADTSATGNELANTLWGNAGDNWLDGGDGDDVVFGGAGNDVLHGYDGFDRLEGGAGNDTYRLGDVADVVVELENGGIDTVIAGGDVTMGAWVENAEAGGGWNTNITGNRLSNSISGNAGDDRLLGGDGHDRIDASYGNDVIDGGNGDDVIVAGEYDFYERNTVYGGAGNDTLYASAGNDTLYGGAGNDIYIQWGQSSIREEAGGGIDTLQGTGRLPPQVENMVVLGDGTAIGNAMNNRITLAQPYYAVTLQGLDGNDILVGGLNADTLDGGAGNDRMEGGGGGDTYLVSSAADVVVEASNPDWAPRDLVRASASFTLSAFVEDLTLLDGTAARDGTGNRLGNAITGNGAANALWGLDGADSLSGGAGADTLWGGNGADRLDGGSGGDLLNGGAGNDLLIVDDPADRVVEVAGGGIDQITTSLSWQLDPQVENLLLTGSAPLQGFGNAMNNRLTGNDAANLLAGQAGNDALFGGFGDDDLYGEGGDDTMTGGSGDDWFWFDGGRDRVTAFEYDDALMFDDALWGGGALDAGEIVDRFARVSNGTVVFDFGGGDVLTVLNPFSLDPDAFLIGTY